MKNSSIHYSETALLINVHILLHKGQIYFTNWHKLLPIW